MKSVLLAVWFALLAAFIFFGAGYQYHAHSSGEARLFHNVDIPGDELNRGQSSVSIKFPAGVKPKYILLPDGRTYPDDSRPRWVEVMADGTKKDWVDGFSVEFGGRP